MKLDSDASALLGQLRELTSGSAAICVALLDGLVDVSHPCFKGAKLTHLQTLVAKGGAADGPMATHGTHVASLLFGQPGSKVHGVAPGCRGLVIPVFSDERRSLSQLDLARGLEQAVEGGAHIINISGGQLGDKDEADEMLQRAVRLCRDSNVLIVAAAGNDGCSCLHVPAALPAVLAVGAMDGSGRPLQISNWGPAYASQGILAPGSNIAVAQPGGGTRRASGTSIATPIVAGVAALLLSLQLARGQKPDPLAVREALLKTALPCDPPAGQGAERCLAGRLNVPGAIVYLTKGASMSVDRTSQTKSIKPSSCGCSKNHSDSDGESDIDNDNDNDNDSHNDRHLDIESHMHSSDGSDDDSDDDGDDDSEQELSAESMLADSGVVPSTKRRPAAARTVRPSSSGAGPGRASSGVRPSNAGSGVRPSNAGSGVRPSNASSGVRPSNASGLVYALGVLGYDFGSEARRDSFKQLMPAASYNGVPVPANPYDARQMVDYLKENLSEAKSLIWTLNLELTPLYAIEAVGPFARDVYQVLQQMLNGQVQAESAKDWIERVSIPARLSGRSVRLFSGQVVPVLESENTRGLYGWNVNALQQAALSAVKKDQPTADTQVASKALRNFLYQVYYKLRNLGQSSKDRALNFAATNAFQVASVFSEAVGSGMELDTIEVTRSPFCRMDSDCWDVTLGFFDPDNIMRARRMFQLTIDVSDMIPVSLGEIRSWASR